LTSKREQFYKQQIADLQVENAALKEQVAELLKATKLLSRKTLSFPVKCLEGALDLRVWSPSLIKPLPLIYPPKVWFLRGSGYFSTSSPRC